MIELAPPGVQTELTPGQSQVDAFQPLDGFADEVMGLLAQASTPPEILEEMVRPFAFAERESRFDQTVAGLNAAH